MVRLFGVILPDEKNIEYSLTLLYGIGFSLAKKILEETRIDPFKKTKDLTEEETKKLIEVIERRTAVEGELREKINFNIQALKSRTRSNARTKRGKRKTVGALKKEVWAKIEQSKSKVTESSKK